MNVFQHKQRSKILVIDDDTRLLELLEASLEDNGFDVTALSTSDEAYALLRKFVPDLILCDINLETSTMGGFTFYEKVQELKNVQSIPFVFLSGLTDEVLVRTGKELGVDDYLMKPISEQTLVSTLRGKLKRFKQLKKAVENPMPTMVAA
jgi:DNA-binding response OmpR family regulator